MAKETKAQEQTVERVMHEFKHGELEIGPGGKAGKVRNAKQAVAIALSQTGVSNRKTPTTKAKEAAGRTAQQLKEGGSAPDRGRAALYDKARKREIPCRSKMNKAELEQALRR